MLHIRSSVWFRCFAQSLARYVIDPCTLCLSTIAELISRSVGYSIDRSINQPTEQSRFTLTRMLGTDWHARFYVEAEKRDVEGIMIRTTRNAYLSSHMSAIMREKNRANRSWKTEAVGGFLRQPRCTLLRDVKWGAIIVTFSSYHSRVLIYLSFKWVVSSPEDIYSWFTLTLFVLFKRYVCHDGVTTRLFLREAFCKTIYHKYIRQRTSFPRVKLTRSITRTRSFVGLLCAQIYLSNRSFIVTCAFT